MKVIEIRVILDKRVSESSALGIADKLQDIIADWDADSTSITDVTYEIKNVDNQIQE